LIAVPIAIHALAITLSLAIWGLAPWKAFSGAYDGTALLSRYQPYLDRVLGGSIATYTDVARFLAPKRGEDKTKILRTKYTPGRHVGRKFKGVWSGILLAHMPPVIAYFWVTNSSIERLLTSNHMLFVIHIGFIAQNICYLFALDFVVWNLTMEGLCKSNSSESKLGMRYLGSDSGIMLLVKAVRQGRPWRVTFFLWLFLGQAIVLRGLLLLFLLDVEMSRYGPDTASQLSQFNGKFWLGWIYLTGFITLPLFVLWLFMPHQAPVCGHDGWRWATIARSALFERGNYGIKANRAAGWGLDVQSFGDWKGTELE
jgi:hypothetical protein